MDHYTENILLSSAKFKEEKDYWMNQLSGIFSTAAFPEDFKTEGQSQGEKASLQRLMDKDLSKKLLEMSNHSEYAVYMILLSGVQYLLYKFTGNEDLVVGMPAFRQDTDKDTGIESIAALRTRFDSGWSFKQLLLDIRKTVGDARKYRNLSFARIAELMELRLEEDVASRIKTMVLMKNIHHEPVKAGTEAAMCICFEKIVEALQIELKYNTGAYKEETVKKIVDYLVNFYKCVLENTGICWNELNVLTPEEKESILSCFNDTATDYPRNKSIHRLLEEEVEKNPDKIALVFEDRILIYRRLNEKANQLARTLQKKGIKADHVVGIMLERSFEMLIGILATLKAGGAYLPIDPDYPAERISYMLEDSGADLLLTQRRFAHCVHFNKESIYMEDPLLWQEDTANLSLGHAAENLAYIIYTSGSTGKPKGVMIEHHSVMNRIQWMQKRYPLDEKDVILLKTTYTFDVSVWELFWWIFAGARLCILSPGFEKTPKEILKAIEKHRVTTLHFVPSMLSIFLDYIEHEKNQGGLASLRQVFASGEALGVHQVGKFNRLLRVNYDTRLFNLYGPTEATIDVSYFNCPQGEAPETIPIGKPIDNTQLYVLDKSRQLQPIGIAGELFISGAGLARGYVNQPELTAEKFLPNPFIPGERMYRTGDLVKWLPDGNIAYLGRIDHQVKIQGFRIELGEIEACLLKHEAVKEAVVIDKTDKEGTKYLYAYIVVGEEISVIELKEHLSKLLPYYMVPPYFKKIDHIPLTVNGKVDRKAVAGLEDKEDIRLQYIPPSNELEMKIAEVWQEVLNIDKIGIDDDIFDLGANSLVAMKLELAMEMNDLTATNVEIFQTRTIRKLAKHMAQRENEEL
jgi:amino acid adenylation domain-containing protein